MAERLKILTTKKPCRVAALARVSTSHEEQMNALGNQEQWLCDLLGEIQDVIFDPSKDLYKDEGKTGTTAKGREGLEQILENSRKGMYDLVVVREASRLMRNTKEMLNIIDELEKNNVEVYFAMEQISSYNKGDRMMLELMASVAQNESLKLSSRVKAGLEVCKNNGVLTSGLNVFGYDYLKKGSPMSEEEKAERARLGREIDDLNVSGRLVPNEREAPIVREIFDMCLQGIGMKTISIRLNAKGLKTKDGVTNWSATSVSRVLHNTRNYGVLTNNKSSTRSAIDKERILKDKDEYEYVESKYILPIIDKKVWDEAQIQLNSRVIKSLKGDKKRGIKLSNDIYVQLMRCECGRRFRKTMGRNETAVYNCRSVADGGSVKQRIDAGGTGEGACTLGGIIDWKLDYYTNRIFNGLMGDIDEIKKTLIESIEECYCDDNTVNSIEKEIKSFNSKIEELERGIKTLIERLCESTLATKYIEEQIAVKEKQIEEYKAHIDLLKKSLKTEDMKEKCIEDVKEFLNIELEESDGKIPDIIIKTYVNSIKVYNDNTFEYNIRTSQTSDTLNMIAYSQTWTYLNRDAVFQIDNSKAVLLEEIQVKMDEAKKYARRYGRRVNKVTWKDATLRAVTDI